MLKFSNIRVMKNLLTAENFRWTAVFLIGMANFFLPIAINLNGLFLTIAAIFVFLQIRGVKVFRNFLNPCFLGCLLLFGMYAISCLWSENIDFAKDSLSRKALIILFPLAFFLLHEITGKHLKLIVSLFTLSNIIVLTVSLIDSGINSYQQHDLNLITHNHLSDFFGLQATYLALYLMTNMALLAVLATYGYFTNRIFLTLILVFFSAGILLTGARSMYVALLLFMLIYLIRSGLKEKKLRGKHVLIGVGILFFASLVIYKIKPLKERIHEATRTDLSLLEMKHFEHDTPFNGVTLRLLFWKFGWEILQEQKAFVGGVGIGDAQDLLEQKFYQYHVYTGNPAYNDTGYLHYNYHNQFVQMTMHIGLTGLLILLILLGVTARKIAQNSDWLMAGIVCAFVILFIVESALERQFGLSHIFFWLPLLYRVKLKNPA